jgi:hypothetical protein
VPAIPRKRRARFALPALHSHQKDRKPGTPAPRLLRLSRRSWTFGAAHAGERFVRAG